MDHLGFSDIFVVPALWLIKVGLVEIKAARSTKKWPTVYGILKELTISGGLPDEARNEANKGYTIYKPRITYTYQVGANNYISHRLTYSEIATSNIKSIKKLMARLKIGEQVKVYYNPNDPTVSVVIPGTVMATYILIFSGIVFAVFAVMWVSVGLVVFKYGH